MVDKVSKTAPKSASLSINNDQPTTGEEQTPIVSQAESKEEPKKTVKDQKKSVESKKDEKDDESKPSSADGEINKAREPKIMDVKPKEEETKEVKQREGASVKTSVEERKPLTDDKKVKGLVEEETDSVDSVLKTESKPTLSHSISREEDKMQVKQSEKKQRKSIENTQIMKESVVKSTSEEKPKQDRPKKTNEVAVAEAETRKNEKSITADVTNTEPLNLPEVQKDKADFKKKTVDTKYDAKTKVSTLEADSKSLKNDKKEKADTLNEVSEKETKATKNEEKIKAENLEEVSKKDNSAAKPLEADSKKALKHEKEDKSERLGEVSEKEKKLADKKALKEDKTETLEVESKNETEAVRKDEVDGKKEKKVKLIKKKKKKAEIATSEDSSTDVIQFDEILDVKTATPGSYLVEEPDSPSEDSRESARAGGHDHAQRVVEISETRSEDEENCPAAWPAGEKSAEQLIPIVREKAAVSEEPKIEVQLKQTQPAKKETIPEVQIENVDLKPVKRGTEVAREKPDNLEKIQLKKSVGQSKREMVEVVK